MTSPIYKSSPLLSGPNTPSIINNTSLFSMSPPDLEEGYKVQVILPTTPTTIYNPSTSKWVHAGVAPPLPPKVFIKKNTILFLKATLVFQSKQATPFLRQNIMVFNRPPPFPFIKSTAPNQLNRPFSRKKLKQATPPFSFLDFNFDIFSSRALKLWKIHLYPRPCHPSRVSPLCLQGPRP